MRQLIALALATVSVPAGIAQGQTAEPVMLNEPSANWSIFGAGQTHKGRKEPAVQGGGAMRVTVAAKPANAWDIGASAPIKGAIAKGDKLVLAFWVRLAEGGTNGRTEIAASIVQATAPYTPVLGGPVEPTNSWKLVHVKGVAAANYAAGAATVALTLGGAAHTVDLGPVFVFKNP